MLALLSDAIRDFSNKSRWFRPSRLAVQRACTRSRDTKIDTEDFPALCELDRLEGNVQVWPQISDRWKGDYGSFKTKLAEISHFRANDSLTIAFVVDHALHHDLLGIAS